MKRFAASLLAALALTVPTSVQPLGLGEIELRSHLNSPLDARIPLHSVSPADRESLRVALGSPAQFARAGIERPFVLSRLKFTVKGQGAKSYIHVTTARPFSEPFINLLLEVDWPNGHTLREYTVLLDPPVYGAAIKSRVQDLVATVPAPPPGGVAPAPQMGQDINQLPIAETFPMPGPGASAQSSSPAPTLSVGSTAYSRGQTYGPVSSSDTLWTLADRFRGGSAVSIQQMMLAMLRVNPDAFLQNNINRLREGAVLRIPTEDEARELSRGSALAEVQRQHAAWDDFRSTVGVRVARQATTGEVPRSSPKMPESADTGKPAEGGAPTTDKMADGSLKLISGGSAKAGVGGESGTSAEVSGLRDELERSREAADASKRESEELAGRLEEAEGVIKELERLVEVQSSELEALQRKLSDAVAGMKMPDASAPMKAPPGTDASAQAGGPTPTMPETSPTPIADPTPSSVAPSTTPDTTPDVTATADAEPTPVKPVVPLPSAVEPKPSSFLDLIRSQLSFLPGDPILFVGAALVALVLGVVGLVFRKRDRAEDIGEPSAAPVTASEEPEEITEFSDVDPNAETHLLDPTDALEETAVEPLDGTVADPDETVGLAVEPQENPLADVNVYLAYEQFEQAESVVKQAIENDPARHEYQLKLLEIYHASKNVNAFEASAATLQEAVGADSEMMGTAREWWAELSPERELFDEADVAQMQTHVGLEPPSDGIFDVTTAGDEDQPPLAGETTSQLSDGLESSQSVDFDLGLDFDDASTGEGTNVDFDLSLDDAPDRGSEDTTGGRSGLAAAAATGAAAAAIGAAALSGGDTEDGALDFDLDAGTGTDVDGEPSSVTGTDLDFDLGALGDEETSTEPNTTGETSDAAELDMDFPGEGTDLTAEALGDTIGDDQSTDELADELATTDFDQDLDFVLDPDLPVGADTTGLEAIEPSLADDDGGLDLGDDTVAMSSVLPGGPPDAEDPGLDFDLGDFGEDFDPSATATDAPLRLDDTDSGADRNAGDDLDLDLDLDTLADTSELPNLDQQMAAAGTDLDFELEVPGSEDDSGPGDEEGLDLDFDVLGAEDTAAQTLDDPAVAPDIPDLDGGGLTIGDLEDGAGPDLDFSLDDGTDSDLAKGADADDIGTMEFDLDLGDEDPTEAPGAASSLSVDEDFADIFGDDDAADAISNTELDGLGELDFSLDDGTDDSNALGAITETPDLDLDALLSNEADDGSDPTLPQAEEEQSDDEITDLNIAGGDILDLASDTGGLMDLELGDSVDFDFDTLDDSLGEPLIEPIDDQHEPFDENKTMALNRAGGGAEVQTKLDLAQAYLDMGDTDGAKGILGEVMAEGNDEQRSTAEALLKTLG